jgi:adenosylhomocysteine nucleosidase
MCSPSPHEVGLICAVSQERDALARVFGLTGEGGDGPFPLWAGEAHGVRVHLAQAGIGKANVAALSAHMLTRHPGIGLMAFCGVAGSLHEGLAPGDLVIGTEVATHDYGALRDGRLHWFPTGDIPIGPAPAPAYLSASPESPALARAMAAFPGRVVRGRIISGDVFLNCRSTRDRLWEAWGADAIDMESAAFAETAARFGAPTLILRTISDRACEASHLSFEEMADAAAANSAAFLAAYVRELGAG